MDSKNRKKQLWNRFLVQLVIFMMVMGMMPVQLMETYALPDEEAVSVEQSAGQDVTQADNEDKQDSAGQTDAADQDGSSAEQNNASPEQNNTSPEQNSAAPEKETPAANEAPAVKAAGDSSGQTSGESGGAVKDSGSPAAEQAEKNYGEGGTAKTFKVSLTDDKDEAYAGDQISYNVNVSMWAAATYPYDGQNQEVMFDKWENITILLDLPENVVITGIKQNNVGTYHLVDEATNTWSIDLNKTYRDATNSNSIIFDVNTLITGNGALADGTVLDKAEVTVSADFNVRIDEEGNTKKYSKTVTDDTETITLGTPDSWVLAKSPYESPKNYTINADGTVTIHYLIEYGLNVNDVPVKDPNVYTRTGRVPFAKELKLTDVPELKLHDGRTIDANSITVTPAKTGYVYKDGSSADQDGQAKPITVTSGTPVDLPYAVVGTNTKNVDPSAPAYSEYKVDMTYNYDDFMVWFYENADKTEADSKNTAEIKYQLLGQTDEKKTSDDGETTIPGYIEPGEIEIDKYIVNYDNAQKKLFSKTNGYTSSSIISGPATYQIFESDGTTPAKIYYKSLGKYHEHSSNTLTIDPAEAESFTNGSEGKITFYVKAGTYVIKETSAPANTKIATEGGDAKTITVNEKGKAIAIFDNKEQLGQISVHKVDDSNNKLPVPGAVIGLYEDAAHTKPVKDESGAAMTQTTNNSGIASFTRLVPGTYYLYEISAPDGYIKSDLVKTVEVTAGNTSDAAIEIINKSNRTVIRLEKWYSTVSNPTSFDLVTSDYAKFRNAFKLQRTIDGVVWTDLGTYSIDNKGTTSVQVDELSPDGYKYSYRFVETIPVGYFDMDGHAGDAQGNQKANSAVIVPADGEDLIEMRNTKGGTIELTKNKVSVNASTGAYTPQKQSGKRFKLYRVAEGSTAAVEVAEATTDANGKITYSDLVAMDSSRKIYTYYVVEQGADEGYEWITDSEINIGGTRTKALRIGSFTTQSGNVLTQTTYNIQQDIVIGIIKKDKLTGTQLKGAKFEVSDGTDTKEITSDTKKATLEIKLDKNYTITEKSVPAGYYLDAASQSINTTGWKVGRKDDGSYAVFKADGTEVTSDDLTFTFEDTPYKKIRLTKKIKDDGQTDDKATTLSGVTFSVYVKEGNNFVPYKVNGTAVTIKADHSQTVVLPEGDYYLHEDTKLNSVVYPDDHPEKYTGKGEVADGKFYFGKYTVTKPTASGDILWDVDVINISNKGDLKVNKVLYDKNNKLAENKAGFTMQVFKADASGNPTGNAIKSATTNAAGVATFADLPVYDTNGNEISYVVKEVYTGDQADLYYTDNFISDASPKTLVLADTVDAGKVVNHTYLSVDVVKKYYDAREYELTGLKYELEGATIALYRNNGDGTYTYIGTEQTDKKGQAAFGKLEYSADGFVAIEVSVPDRPEFKYMVPVEGDYLKPDATGKLPETLTQAQVDELSKAALVSTTDPQYSGVIENVIPWTQIHVTKYDNLDRTKKLNGANFTLYKQVLPEGTSSGELTFDAANCSVVGEYTSGTWIHNEEPQTGEFQTDVLESADNVVYWLVETKAPSGYSIIDNYKVVLFPREGTSYTNNSNDGRSTMVYPGGLKDNKINYFDVYNSPNVGPGGTENWAFIEFNKWRQKESTADKKREDLTRNDFVLMPNATFELYAVNASDHNKVLLLDTITTGDENDQFDGSHTTGYGVSRSMDAWAIFDEIEKKYPDQLDDIITYKSAEDSGYDVTYPYVVGPDGKPVEDAQGHRTRIKGTFTLNAVLIEKSASSKYELDLHDHNLQITFIPSSLYLGNDKYAVPIITKPGDRGRYSSDLCDNDERRLDYEDNDSQSMAIVDYLSTDNSVVLRHFGYDPEQTGYAKFHDDLEALHESSPGLFVSKKVTYKLEKYNPATKAWEAWSPTENKKLPSGTGTFETDGNGYHFDKGLDPGDYRVIMTKPADGYENFYPNANTAFKFTVVTTGRTQVFTTYSPEKPDVTIEKVDLNGRTVSAAATFRLVRKAGTAYDQTASTSDGKAVFKDLPADTTFTLSETKAPAGYTNAYFAKLFSKQYPDYANLVNGTGYALSYTTAVKDGEKYIVEKEYNKAFSLKVPNTETVKLKLIKKDAQNDQKFLEGAQFKIYYLAFDKVSGSYTVPAYPEGGTWTDLGTVTAGTDGTITKSGVNPGVYYVVETKAPDHYDLDPEGKTIVMTGGMDLTVAQSDKYTVNTVSGGTGELEFKDMPKVNMIVDKDVELGSLDPRDYSFTFTLKDSEGKTIAGDPAKASRSGSTETNAVFKDLSQGKKYYLKEETAAGYKLDKVMVGNKAVSPETTGDFKGYYEIEIPTDGSNVTVTVSNILLEAKVKIFKYDGETGTGLTGASFEVLKSDGKTVVTKASITDNGDGSYTAVIPLEGTTAANFYIRETKAPDGGYTIDENNKDILVRDLTPGAYKEYKFNGTEATDNELVLPNFKGIDVTVLKYGGLPDNTGVDPLAGAKFQMYFSTDGGNNWSTWHPAETTGSDGKATFQILKGYDYAVAEINDVKGYVGIYGVYKNNTKLETKTSSDGRTLYVLGKDFDNGQTYEFKAYNIPYLKLIVEKEDLSNTVEDPNVDFHVYEVPDGTPTTLTDEQISDLAAASKVFIEDKTKDSTYTNEQFIRPGKTYLAVEDHAFDTKGEFDDYSIIRDDSRVVSYEVFSVPEKNYEEEYSVLFKNNKGDATIDLEKTVDKEKVDSLTVKDAELTYTLKPESTNGYALDAYKLTDSGLTPDPSNATLADEWYNITEVIVGQGLMDKYLRGAKTSKDYQIFAAVTFVGFDGTEYKQTPVNVSQGNITVVPTGTSGKNIKSFYVEYSSPDLLTDTGYALGQNFSAGETVVKATVFKQEKPDEGVITAVKKIINDADVQLTYTPWSSTGEKEKEPVTIKAEDDAETIVEDTKAPKIAFSKDGPDPDTPVELGSELTYKLTVTNVSEEELDFTDPIIVDLLPRGLAVDQESAFVKVASKPDTIAADPVVTTGYAGESQYVNIAFTGTVAKGESIEVELTATATNAVTNYGNYMRNFAFTTSKEVGVATSENVTGAVIKDDDGLWASELVSLATGISCDKDRAEALKAALGKQGTYGYLGDWHENFWVTDNELVCVKSEYGPSDGGVYRTDKVAVLVNDENDVSQRTMHYRLTINNESASKRTNLAVMDILPVVGDNRINNTPRGSNWDLYFDKMGAVTVNGESCDDYTVYFYDRDATAFGADDITDIITEAKDGCPSGWSTSKPDKPTAFIVAFNYDKTDATEVSDGKTVVLEGMKTVQIEYTAVTDYREAEPLAEIVFTNAANDFNFGFSTFAPPSTADKAKPNDPLGSNVVEVTIAPPKVKVGGDVWIDADDNGVQDDGDQSWYLGFDIVKQLIRDLDVDLSTSNLRNFGVVEETAGTINETGSDAKNYGIAHFEFDNLTSAKLRNKSTDYLNWNDGSAAKLIGKNPYTYHMNMSYKGNTFLKTINTIDPRGSWIPGQIPEADQKDDNFNTLLGGYRTEQFFLHQTADPNWDMTKDIGFNLHRSLELTKTSRADGEPVEGAEFTIYGPFEHDTGAKQELDDAHKVASVTTDKDGKASKENLLFFKEYVIVETKAAKGFGIEGAIAEGANITKLDEGKWLLNVPGKSSVSQEEKVTVRYPENIEVEVEKIWNDDDDAYASRPGSIKVMLYTDEKCTEEAKDADGKTVESKTLSAANGWKDKWTDLPRYKVKKSLLGEETETELTYYVKETDSEGKDLHGYEVSITPSRDETTGNQTLKITNTPISTGLEVRKTWVDTDDAASPVTAVSFRVEQSADGEKWTPVKAHGKDIILTIERKKGEKLGTAEIDGLPAYDADDKPLTYRAVEISITVAGKTLEVADGKVGCYEVSEKHTPGTDASAEKATVTDLSEITNTMIPTEFSVEKTFSDDKYRLSSDITSIKVLLQRKSGSGSWTDVQDYDLKMYAGWKHTWTGLPKLDPEGKPYEYRAVEVSYTTNKGRTVEVKYSDAEKTAGTVGPFGYTSRVAGTADVGYTSYLANTPLVGSLRVNKEWKNVSRTKTPESLTITLKAFADGKEIRISGMERSVTLSKDNNWTDNTTWSGLPVYDVNGNRIVYSLSESGKADYKAEYSIVQGGKTEEGDGGSLNVKINTGSEVDATFINTYEGPVKTGDSSHLPLYAALLTLAAAELLLLIFRKRRSM